MQMVASDSYFYRSPYNTASIFEKRDFHEKEDSCARSRSGSGNVRVLRRVRMQLLLLQLLQSRIHRQQRQLQNQGSCKKRADDALL